MWFHRINSINILRFNIYHVLCECYYVKKFSREPTKHFAYDQPLILSNAFCTFRLLVNIKRKILTSFFTHPMRIKVYLLHKHHSIHMHPRLNWLIPVYKMYTSTSNDNGGERELWLNHLLYALSTINFYMMHTLLMVIILKLKT